MTRSPRYRHVIAPTATDVARVAAEAFIDAAHAAVQAHDSFCVALAGGTTPRELYALLATPPYREQVDWSRVRVFFGDERTVPPDHPDSNYRMARASLLDRVPVPAGHVHRMEGELPDACVAAQRYAEVLSCLPQDENGTPRFDLVLLGMGEDGHTASLFPGTTILKERDQMVAAVYVDKLASWRLSLTLPVLDAAAHVMLLVTGENKRPVVTKVMTAAGPLPEYPVSCLRPRPQLIWYLDRAAAAGIGGAPGGT